MNKKIYLLPLLLLLALLSTSCQETKEAGKFDNWQAKNQAYLDSLQNVYDTKPDHGGLNYFVPFSDAKMKIYYKVITENEAGQRPIIPNVVSLFYRGTFITGEMFDQNFTGKDPSPFDKPIDTWIQPVSTSNAPYLIPIPGWIETLQHMRTGERWLVYIPWEMAYGTNNYSSPGSTKIIPGYSVLIFDIDLLKIVKQ